MKENKETSKDDEFEEAIKRLSDTLHCIKNHPRPEPRYRQIGDLSIFPLPETPSRKRPCEHV